MKKLENKIQNKNQTLNSSGLKNLLKRESKNTADILLVHMDLREIMVVLQMFTICQPFIGLILEVISKKKTSSHRHIDMHFLRPERSRIVLSA